MTTKHTPGPWIKAKYKVRTAGGDLIAHTRPTGEGSSDDEANARLIAAAPEMLAALRKAAVVLAGACTHAPELEPHATYDSVSAAIAKATGCAA